MSAIFASVLNRGVPPADDLLMAAMAGVSAQTLNDDKHHAAFVTELRRRMKAKAA